MNDKKRFDYGSFMFKRLDEMLDSAQYFLNDLDESLPLSEERRKQLRDKGRSIFCDE